MATKPAKKPAAFKPCADCKAPGKCAAMQACAAKGMKHGGKVGRGKH
jgi:hypothetical protein